MKVEHAIGQRQQMAGDVIGDPSGVGVPSGRPGKSRLRLPPSIGEVRVPARKAGGDFMAGE